MNRRVALCFLALSVSCVELPGRTDAGVDSEEANANGDATANTDRGCDGSCAGESTDDFTGSGDDSNCGADWKASGGTSFVDCEAVPVGNRIALDLAAALDACDDSALTRVTWRRPGELRYLTVGKWFACPDYPSESVEKPHPEAVGVEFFDDGTYAYILRNELGEHRLGTGIDQTGTWLIALENGPTLTFPGPYNSFTYERPTFTEAPAQLRLTAWTEPFWADRYVLVDDSTF